MTIAAIKKDTKQKMNKSIDTLRINLCKVRTGRVHADILSHIQVEYYGTLTNISQVSNIIVINTRTLGIQTWEKNMLVKIEKSIRESSLGLNPVIQGDIIHVLIPFLTEERRKELVKLVKNYSEEAKISIRNIRRDAKEIFKKLIKDKICSEDETHRAEASIQILTDKFITEVDTLVFEKEKEVLTV